MEVLCSVGVWEGDCSYGDGVGEEFVVDFFVAGVCDGVVEP